VLFELDILTGLDDLKQIPFIGDIETAWRHAISSLRHRLIWLHKDKPQVLLCWLATRAAPEPSAPRLLRLELHASAFQ
jgi:hypothetical protein